jgi:hypothetical protein
MFLTRTACITLAVCLSGCAGISAEQCLSMDWRTVGFEDGARGRPVQSIGNYRQACGEHGVTADLDGYRAGHTEGVEVYCRPVRGFEEGRNGARYQGVCPTDIEPEFLAAYDSGRQLYELERALAQIERQIAADHREQENIKRRLTEIGAAMISDGASAEERLLMVTESAELGKRYGELSTEIDALEEERVVREIELSDYQQTLAYSF